jgi:hypothetical protein
MLGYSAPVGHAGGASIQAGGREASAIRVAASTAHFPEFMAKVSTMAKLT